MMFHRYRRLGRTAFKTRCLRVVRDKRDSVALSGSFDGSSIRNITIHRLIFIPLDYCSPFRQFEYRYFFVIQNQILGSNRFGSGKGIVESQKHPQATFSYPYLVR
jgi:hypothetical protein